MEIDVQRWTRLVDTIAALSAQNAGYNLALGDLERRRDSLRVSLLSAESPRSRARYWSRALRLRLFALRGSLVLAPLALTPGHCVLRQTELRGKPPGVSSVKLLRCCI